MTNTTPQRNYTGYAIQGSEYDTSLSIAEINRKIRKELNELYPEVKFSVTKRGNKTICIEIVSAPFEVYTNEWRSTSKRFKESRYDMNILEELEELAHFSSKYTNKGEKLINTAEDVANQYRFDDSDTMVDYFDYNFICDVKVGWDY